MPRQTLPPERARQLFYAIVGDRKHPATIADEEGTSAEAIFAELAQLGIEIPHALMPRDPRLFPTTNWNATRSRAHQPQGWLTPGEAAAALGVTTKAVRRIAEREGIEVRWTDGGYGAGRRPRGDRRYSADDVARVVGERRAQGRDRDRQWWIKQPDNQAYMQRRRQESGRLN